MAYSWKNGILKGLPIGENTVAGTALATLVAQDSNMTEAFFYTLSGSDSSLFNIDIYGRLSLKQAIDYDTTGGWWRSADGQWHNPDHRYSVVVNAFNDTGVLQTATTFILTVMDVNEAPVFQWQQQPLWGQNSKGAWNIWASGDDTIFLNISENNVAGMQVAKFRALDPEMGSNVTYDITGADKGYFSIDSNGRLYLKSSLNFEDMGHTAHNYSVVVVAGAVNGGAVGMVSDLVVISLGNVDDNPTVWKAPPVSGLVINQKAGIDSIAALASPLSIANFAASDGDAGQWVSYYLSGHDSWLFSIDSNGVLMRKYDFDYEKIGAVRPNHQIWVMVSAYTPPGGGVKTWGGHISQLFILTINDLANTSLSGIALNENNAIGDSVGQFAILAGGNVAVTYNLGGTDANYFTVDATGNLKLKSVLNFEDAVHTAHHYSVVVTANPIDGSGATSQLFILSLGNADDNATVWKKTPLSGRAIDENGDVAASTVLATAVSIAQFEASDGDGQAIGYNLSGGDAALFSIDGNGVLYRKVDFDYETIRASHQFTVMVHGFGKPTADGITVNGVSISQLFVLTINNVAEAAGFVATTTGAAVNENNTVGLVVGNFLATDSAAAAMTYSLGGTDANYFTIDATGNLKLKSVLDFEDVGHVAQNYTVVVTAGSVVGNHIASQVFVLSLGNVDEATSFVVAPTSGGAISENNAVGIVVGNFLATDGDKVAVTYSLGGTDANYFTIDATGNLKLKSSLDFEDTNHTAKNYSVVVMAKATDASPAISQLFVLTLGDVAEAASFVAAPTGGAAVSENNTVGVVVGNFLATDSAAAAMTYGLGGTDANYFTIDATGNLKLKSVLDFEDAVHTAQNYTVVVTAGSVVGNHIASQVFVLSLGNVDEATSFVVAPTSGGAISENNAVGIVVGNFLATDGDKVAVTYSLGGTDANYFTIDATGNLKLKSSLDFEDTNHTAKNYSVVVMAKATDASPAISQLFVLTLGDVAEAASFVAAPTGGAAVSENNTVGVVVGNFLATDSAAAAMTYGLGGTDANYFTIDATGNLKLKSVLDFEDAVHTAQNYTVVVTAGSVVGGHVASQVFVLSLGNVDEATSFVATTTGSAISENNTVGVVVGNFLATDSDKSVVTYSLGGTDANYFTIDAAGNLKLKSSLDYEDAGHTAQNYSVVVTAKATDASPAISQLFVLSLGDVAEAAGFVAAPTGGVGVSENNTVGFVVGNFLATDSAAAAMTYGLGGTDANYFTIDATGNLKLKSSLDFEDTGHTAQNYTVVVTAGSVVGGHVASQVFVLSLGNVDEATSFVATTTGSAISENNTVGVVVGNFLATDSDKSVVTYSLGGTDANYFTIDAAGNLKLKSSLDFEDAVHTAKNYSVVVTAKATDASPAISQLFVLSLGDVAEAAGFVATTTGAAVNENNTVGLVVGNFLATDSAAAAMTYGLGGTDANYFTIDATGNLKLKSVLDFEDTGHTAQNYTVVVTAGSVVGGHFASQVFVLSLGNVDEATSFVATTTGAAVSENNTVGFVVGNFLATDGDKSAVTYSLGGTDANYFTIDATGNLKLKSSLDFEDVGHTAHNYSVVVTAKATDASPAISQLFVLTLGDVAEAASFVAAPTGGAAVSENNTVGVVVGNFLATDSAAAAMTYGIGGTDANYFTIDATGNLKLKSILDFEDTGHTAQNYTVVVTAGSVVGNHVASQVFVLSLGNVDEATSFVVAPTGGAAISENNTVGFVVGNFLATDGDKVAVTYSLGGTDANYFTIDATGNLKLKSSLDFEDTNHTAKNYSVVVTAKATDTSPAISQLFILTLGDVAEAAGFVAAPTGGVGVSENNTVGFVVGNFLATDSAAAAMTYGLGGTDANYFTIDATSNLKLKSVLDFEDAVHTAQNYTVVVTAGSVVGNHVASQVFVLSLGNVDEATSFVATMTGAAISENNTVGFVVGNFLATDGDKSAVTYSLGGTDANYFTIDATGNLKLKSSLDFEDVGHTAHNYSVVVTAKATDASAAISQLFVLSLGDVAEAAGFVAAPTGGVGVSENNAVGFVVGNFLATDSAAAAMTYGLGGTDANYFTIDATGNLKLKSVLDFEDTGHTAQNYTVVVTAGSVVGSHVASQVFVLSLGNVDEATSFVATMTGAAVSENNTVGLVVGNFLATDSDKSVVTYSLGGTDANYFTIDAAGNLKLKSSLDFEDVGHTAKNYSVVVTAKATDTSPAISQLFILTLGDVAEAAGFVAAPTGGVGVSENNAVGFVVGNFLATDSAAAAMTYGLGGTDANYFTIDATGNLKLKSVLDFEDAGHVVQNYTVVVTAGSVVGSHVASQVFVLSLGNVDEATSFVATMTGAAVSENNTVGFVVGNFLATDGDGAAVTYGLGGTDANYFTIDATGNLKLKSVLDFEDAGHTAQNYTVVVTAKSTDASSAISQVFVLSLGNSDEITRFATAPTGGAISENNALGIVVGNFLATDGDGAAVTYDLSGTDANYFTIDATGKLKLTSVLDFEDAVHTAKNYSVVVTAKATDASGAISQLFVLSLGNVDEATSFVATTTGSAISENNAVGVVVGNFLATDGDGAKVTYSLGGTDANYFTIDANGDLKLKSVLDFENAGHTAHNYSVVVKVKATDASPAISQLFVLSLGNGDEATNFAATTTGSAMSENNALGIVVGNFLATDGDGAAVTYDLSGADANYFTIDATGKLKLNSRLDYEDTGHTAQNYTVVVTAGSVVGSHFASQVFVLSLGNVDEATSFVATTTGSAISENNAVGVVVGNFLATDGDKVAVTYSLGGTDANYFTIDANGDLKLKSVLDFENAGHTAKNYSVVVRAKATDASPAISQLFVLSLGNGDEATSFVATTTGSAMSENNAVGVVVGNFLATDGDGAAVTYGLGGTDANYFTIDSTGKLKLTSRLDYEDAGHTAQNYTVLVTAGSVVGSHLASQVFVLSLGNADEATGFVATTRGGAISENNVVDVVVGNFLATDGDGAAVTYSLGGTDANYFTIDATGNLKLTSILDFEDVAHTAKNYSVVITAKSTDASPAISQLFVLSLGNGDEATGFVAAPTGGVDISENNAVGIVVGNFLATDGDGAKATYSLGGTDANYFTIDSTGNLKLKSVLDFENAGHTAKNYSVVVMAKSTDASPAISQLFVLTLGNVDDPTSFIATTTGAAVTENNTVGVVVANFLATDGDGASVTYDLSGADANYFTIDATGKLKLNSSLDFEDANHTAKNYSVVITAKATDASPAISQLFVLSLGNVGEAASFIATTTGADISENNTVGVVVGNFLATDGDGAKVTYSLGGTDANYFTIDATGDIKLKSILDFENAGHTAKNYSVVLTAKSTDASPAISQLFILTLGNVDDPTSFVATTTGVAITENNALGIVVGTFLATDGDGVAVTYDLSGTDANYFTIDATGKLKLNSSLDFEDANHAAHNYSVVITAKATDASDAISQLFILTLGDVSDSTRFVTTTTRGVISENNAVDASVANFLATNVNGATVTYSLGGIDANYFTIDATGNLKLKSVLDFENTGHTAHSYIVMVTAKATDASGAVSQLFTLSLVDVPDSTSFVATTTGNAINENNTLGASVANFLATNITGAMITYSLGGIDANYFTIDANGNLKLKSVLDFEDAGHTAPNYSVVVTASATNASGTASQLFVLTLGNVAEPMRFASTTTGNAISENNAVDIVVGNFLATEVTLAVVTYSLAGTDANYFTIDANGSLKIKSILDFEDAAHPAHNYTVVVVAKSDQGVVISGLFVLSLDNVDEGMSFVAATTGSEISENNAVDVSVANFLATEVAGAAVTYSLGGTDANCFTIDANGNLKLISVLDYENAWHSKNYSVVVTANPTNGGDAISQVFILSLGNVVEPMSFVAPPTGRAINENNAVGLSVANFSATKVNGVAATYSLGGTDSDYFTINADGSLRCKSILDFEDVWHTAKNYSVVVTATSPNGTATISQLFVLSLGNVNEPVSFVATTTGSAISENNAVGAVVGNFLATEVNKLAVTYSLAGTDSAYFTIAANGNLKLKSSLDFEDAGHATNYSVVVVAKSDQGGAVSKLFVLSLNNVYEATNFVAATRSAAISENNAVGVAVANFLATNLNGAMVTYSLGGVDANYFTINANGNLKLASSLDYEDAWHTAKNYSVVITASPTDASGAISQLFVLRLGDVGEAMFFVNTTSGTTSGNAISENNATGLSVANFLALNANGLAVTYNLGGIDANYFTIDANGALKLISVLDFEDTWHTAKNYSVVVTATAGGGIAAISQLFVLSLGNVNEPMSFTTTIAGIAMSENNTVGVVVANCLATEATAATVTYSLGGTDADYFTIDATGKLKLISILDYEDLWRIPPDPFINWPPPINGTYKPNYSVVITATSDQGGLISRLFVVSLGDVPEPTSFVEMTTGVTISENNAVDLAVGNFLATNVNGAMVTYSIGGVDSGYFTIDANGNLKLTAILDYEDESRHIPNKNNPAFLHWERNHKYSVVVTASATDASGAVSKLFVLKIDDVAEPISMGFGGSYWIQPMPESSAIGTQIVGVSAVDNSPGTVPGAVYNTYIRLDNMEADNKYFTLVYDRNQRGNSLNGNIVLASMLDFEDAQHPSPYYTILARASSQKGNSVSQLFIFTLGDVAEPMGFAAPAGGGVISENNVVGVTVANFLATDVSGSAMVYSLSGDDAKYFFLDANGNLRLTEAILDYEDMWRPHPMYYDIVYTQWNPIYDVYNPNYSVVVTASAAGKSVSKLFVVTVVDVAEATNFVSMTRGVAISENNAVGVAVANFLATEVNGATVTYSLSGADANYFTINAIGSLKLVSVLDYENAAHLAHNYSVVVTAKSDQGGSVSRLFVLSLGNVAGASHADHVAYIDGTTATHAVNVGGIIGHDDAGNIDYANVQFHGVNYTDKVITHQVDAGGLQSTTVDYVVRGISDLESLKISFNGFTDTDGSKHNHWFFVQDDATDHSGHIVFDADGQNVNLHSFTDGGGLATSDQINLLAGSNYGIDGDFSKPADLDLNLASDPLHQNIAGALTFDQFLALLGGSQHISFV